MPISHKKKQIINPNSVSVSALTCDPVVQWYRVPPTGESRSPVSRASVVPGSSARGEQKSGGTGLSVAGVGGTLVDASATY